MGIESDGSGEQPGNGGSATEKAHGSVSDVMAGVVGEMPTPQEHAIAAEAEDERQTEESRNKWAGYTDRNGAPFNPSIHVTDSNGNPVLTQKDKLRIKPGRGSSAYKNRDSASPKSTLHRPGQSTQRNTESTAPTSGDSRATGQLIAEQIFAIGQMIGGEEWAPIEQTNPKFAEQYGINERAMQYEAWANYCEAKDVRDIPPGIMVCVVMMQYVGLRLAMPKTKTRMQVAKQWVGRKIADWKTRSKGGKTNAQPDSRDDVKRENERGEMPRA